MIGVASRGEAERGQDSRQPRPRRRQRGDINRFRCRSPLRAFRPGSLRSNERARRIIAQDKGIGGGPAALPVPVPADDVS